MTNVETIPRVKVSKRARARGKRVNVTVRANPGRDIYRAHMRKRDPRRVSVLSDRELLALFVPGEQALNSLLERLNGQGVKGLHQIENPSRLLELPGIDEGTAGRVLALYELAARIAEGA